MKSQEIDNCLVEGVESPTEALSPCGSEVFEVVVDELPMTVFESGRAHTRLRCSWRKLLVCWRRRQTFTALYNVIWKGVLATAMPGRSSKQKSRMFVPMFCSLEDLVMDPSASPYFRVDPGRITLTRGRSEGSRVLKKKKNQEGYGG